jgi:hypothetical protein
LRAEAQLKRPEVEWARSQRLAIISPKRAKASGADSQAAQQLPM